MTDRDRLDTLRKAFADITGELEDAALVASEAQSTPDLVQARRVCNRLIGQLAVTQRNLDRLLRQLQ